jgi:lipocalin
MAGDKQQQKDRYLGTFMEMGRLQQWFREMALKVGKKEEMEKNQDLFEVIHP